MSQYIDEKFVKLLRSAYKEKGNMILIYKMMQKGTQKKKEEKNCTSICQDKRVKI